MTRSLLAIAVLLPAAVLGAPPVLRFEGLYQSQPSSPKGDPYWSYFRFYPDGTVRDVSSTGKPEEVARWIGNAGTGTGTGKWELTGRHLSFVTRVAFRSNKEQRKEVIEVAYSGSLRDDGTLELTSESKYNGYRGKVLLSFVKLKLPP
ncbi:MAG: hypothetical protein ACYC8T_15770 [Myxococcaceae bacterium]